MNVCVCLFLFGGTTVSMKNGNTLFCVLLASRQRCFKVMNVCIFCCDDPIRLSKVHQMRAIEENVNFLLIKGSPVPKV